LGKEEKNFCVLCGKTRSESLTAVTLGVIEETGLPINVQICSLCGVIVHNIKRLYEDAKRVSLKNTETVSEIIKKGGKDAKDSQG